MSSDPPPPSNPHDRDSMSDRQSAFSENVFSDIYAVGNGDDDGNRGSAYSRDGQRTPTERSNPDPSEFNGHTGNPGNNDQQDPFRDDLEVQSTAAKSGDEPRTSDENRSSMSTSTPSLSMVPASIPRAMSPYVGQTGPSYPYGMYAQDTGVDVGNIGNMGMNNVGMNDLGANNLGMDNMDTNNLGVNNLGVNNTESTSDLNNTSGMAADGLKSSPQPSRPADEPMPVSRPQHPYFMYPQNTVPDELLEQPTTQIPIGFPGHNAVPPTIPDDFGDIVGPDGHTEQLPPYSRFAPEDYTKENTAAEENRGGAGLPIAAAAAVGAGAPLLSTPGAHVMDPSTAVGAANGAQGFTRNAEPSIRSISPHGTAPGSPVSHGSLQPPPTPDSQRLIQPPAAMTVAPTNEASILQMGGSSGGATIGEKEPLSKRTSTLCGISLMRLVLIAVVLALAAVAGGVVGLVVGKQNASRPTKASSTNTNSASEYAQLSTTPGEILDATPISSVPSSLLPVPTGSYAFSLNQREKSTSCFNNNRTYTWKCIESGSYGARVGVSKQKRNIITFGSHNVTGKFNYGPQPAIFHQTRLNLSLAEQVKHEEYGPALFARTFVDKLVILPQEALDVPDASRASDSPTVTASLSESNLKSPQENNFTLGQTSRGGDLPVFCWWNSTLFEIFIFLNDTIDTSSSTGTASIGYISDEPTTGTFYNRRAQLEVRNLSSRDDQDDNDDDNDNDDSFRYYSQNRIPGSYPLVSRMIERSRTSGSHFTFPYCEQRQVSNDGGLSEPLTNKIYLTSATSPHKNSKRRNILRRSRIFDHSSAESPHLAERSDLSSFLDETCSCNSLDDED